MKFILSSYSPAFKFLFKDKVNFILAIIPVLIGVALYSLLGGWLYQVVLPAGEAYISSYFSSDTVGDVFYYIVAGIAGVLMYFLVSFTMVLIISLISSPFNDFISARIEKIERGETPQDLSEGLKSLVVRLVATLFNEIKKVILIIFFSFLAFLLNLLPVLAPVAFIITAILFAVQFVDYSWSRHELESRDCYRDARRNWGSYAISGSGFLLLTAVPIINLFLPSYATSYYTVLWIRIRKRQLIES